MTKSQYIIIIRALLLLKNSDECDPKQAQQLIDHFDKCYQEAAE